MARQVLLPSLGDTHIIDEDQSETSKVRQNGARPKTKFAESLERLTIKRKFSSDKRLGRETRNGEEDDATQPVYFHPGSDSSSDDGLPQSGLESSHVSLRNRGFEMYIASDTDPSSEDDQEQKSLAVLTERILENKKGLQKNDKLHVDALNKRKSTRSVDDNPSINGVRAHSSIKDKAKQSSAHNVLSSSLFQRVKRKLPEGTSQRHERGMSQSNEVRKSSSCKRPRRNRRRPDRCGELSEPSSPCNRVHRAGTVENDRIECNNDVPNQDKTTGQPGTPGQDYVTALNVMPGTHIVPGASALGSPENVGNLSLGAQAAIHRVTQLQADEDMARQLQADIDTDYASSIATTSTPTPVNPNIPFVDISITPQSLHVVTTRSSTELGPYSLGDVGEASSANPGAEELRDRQYAMRIQRELDTTAGDRSETEGAITYFSRRDDEYVRGSELTGSDLTVLAAHVTQLARRGTHRTSLRSRNRVQYEADHNYNVGEDYEDLLRLSERIGYVKKRLTPHQISLLPIQTFKKCSSQQQHECNICMCSFEDGEKIKILPCFHGYHTDCIDPWIKENTNCPVCRTEIKFH